MKVNKQGAKCQIIVIPSKPAVNYFFSTSVSSKVYVVFHINVLFIFEKTSCLKGSTFLSMWMDVMSSLTFEMLSNCSLCYYSCGLSTVTIEYSCLSVCV